MQIGEFLMIDTFEFVLASAALLLTPGPTNTLMALAGVRLGWQGAPGRIAAELVAYLAVTTPLLFVGVTILNRWPDIGRGIQFCAALWVGWLAFSFWRDNENEKGALETSSRRVFVTTLLNPKSLIFGLALLPQGDIDLLPHRVALFSMLIVLVAYFWTSVGLYVNSSNFVTKGLWLQRVGSVWLAVLSIGLLANSMQMG
jgi:threonine/homoserine/homoserine lactone efflux protein